jgi:hypothetical protein
VVADCGYGKCIEQHTLNLITPMCESAIASWNIFYTLYK